LAEAALKLLCERSVSREAFGKPLAKLGGNIDIIADARINLEMTRLLCLKAAWMMDNVGTDAAQPFISMIKVAAPNMAIKIIDEAGLPKNLNPQLIIGNHDNRDEFKINFPNIETDPNGFIQYFKDIDNKRLIFIDTNLINTHQGHYCEERQEWLNNILGKTNTDTYIFMHHNPLALVKEESDGIGLQQKKEFQQILTKNNKIIKHIFFGHQHITSSGSYCGITFSSPRSTWSPLIPNFSNEYRLGTANTDTNYNVAIIRSDALIIHTEDFLKTEVNWF